MAFLGFITRQEARNWQEGTPFLPDFSFYEKHESAPIAAEPAEIIRAVRELDMQQDPVIRRLLALRQLPSGLLNTFTGRRGEPQEGFSFDSFTPLYQDSHEISMGLTGRFWRFDTGLNRLNETRQFTELRDRDAARLVLRFQVKELGDGTSRLKTETFVHCPSLRTKCLFACYWGAIRPASGWVRRRTLKAIERSLARA